MKLITLVLLFVSLASFATSPQEAYSRMKAGKAVIIDVREKEEVEKEMIDGALWFPMSKIESNDAWKPEFEKVANGKEIFLYCRSGRRSGNVQKILETNNVKAQNLGGIETLRETLPVRKN
jgi:rhodanese-related sulfurtransferase